MLASPVPMHIPDGFLSVLISVLLWVVSIATIAYALQRVNADLDERKVPLMGVLAAAIFAGQMLNFTVVGGTSGHLMGAALATILLGPWAAILVMTCVVGIQALIFQDGGLLVLGGIPALLLPVTMLITPGGSPASATISAKSSAERRVLEAGLSTTVLPIAIAGAIFQANISSGKFQGMICPTTPTGW